MQTAVETSCQSSEPIVADNCRTPHRRIRQNSGSATPNAGRPRRIAILSLLFNWPSTGGGTVHTAELGKFLARAGYDVKHIYAKFAGWGLGNVTEPLDVPSAPLGFEQADWNAFEIQRRFRDAVDFFAPDYVIITDSWNFKPLLAEAVRGYRYFLRLAAQECLCPLNNVRLLVDDQGRSSACPLNQLATAAACRDCVSQRQHQSGSLHQAERALSGYGTAEYDEKLRRAFAEAEGVLAVNPLIAAAVSPYTKAVHVVPSGFDPNRFPWPNESSPLSQGGPRGVALPGDHQATADSDVAWVSTHASREARGLKPTLPIDTARDSGTPNPTEFHARNSELQSHPSHPGTDVPGSPTRLQIFFAGLVGEYMKGFRVLHAACAKLWEKRQDFELVATSDPPGQFDPMTRFIGWQPQHELPKHLRQADFLVFPTIAEEALGRSAVEAMGVGRPVIASRIGGLPYTVIEGLTGLLFEPGNAFDLAEKIEMLLDDPALRQRLGEAGRKQFETHFTWDVIIDKHYRKLLAPIHA